MSRRRPMTFTLVGIVGYVVQTAALWLLAGRADVAILPATLLSTELAVLHNFVWHVRWTWADRPAGPMTTVGRLLRFNVANGGVSLVGGALLMPLLVTALGVHYLLANMITVLICAIVNYLAGDRWVFAPARQAGSAIAPRLRLATADAERREPLAHGVCNPLRSIMLNTALPVEEAGRCGYGSVSEADAGMGSTTRIP